MSFEDFIDEEVIELVNELENPKKYHYEEHSDDTIHFYMDSEEIDYEEVIDLLNKQEETIQTQKDYLVYMGHGTIFKEMKGLKEENKQLKNEVYDWKASAEDYLKLGQSLKKENEQLKEEINYLKGQLKAYSEVSPEGKWILNNGDVE